MDHIKQLDKLSSIISSAFSTEETALNFEQVEIGLNSRSHFSVSTSSGNTYGIKVPVRGTDHGLENEKLLGDLAELLDCPNFCPVRQTDQIDFIKPFKDKKVNITRWHKDSQTIYELAEASKDNTLHDVDSERFLFQIGEWMSFALAFGVHDRNDFNFVWNEENGLSMIDMEVGLRTKYIDEFYWLCEYFSSDKAEKPNQRRFLTSGYDNFQRKLNKQKPDVLQLLKQYPHSSEYELQSEGPAEQTILQFLDTFFYV